MHTKNAWVSLIGLILLVAIVITAVILTRPTNEPVMLTIQAINRDAGKDTEDYWVGSTQTVYYNGDVEYYDEYHLVVLNTKLLIMTEKVMCCLIFMEIQKALRLAEQYMNYQNN